MTKQKRSVFWKKLIFDGGLLLASFGIVHMIKHGVTALDPGELRFLGALAATWLVVSLVSRKFKPVSGKSPLASIRPFVVSNLLFVGVLTIILFGLQWYLSRFIVYGSIGLFFMLEVLFLSGVYHTLFEKSDRKTSRFPFLFFLSEVLLMVTAFAGIYFYKTGTMELSDEYRILLMVILFLWIGSGLVFHQFHIRRTASYAETIWPFVKSVFATTSLVVFFAFASHVAGFSRFIVFGSLAGFALFEWVIVTLYFVYTRPRSSDEAAGSLMDAAVIEEQGTLDRVVLKSRDKPFNGHGQVLLRGAGLQTSLFRNKLESVYLKKFPRVFAFLDREVDLHSADILTALVLCTGDAYNVEILPEDSLELFLNLRGLNSFRRVNEYMIRVNERLVDDGLFVSCFQPKEKRRIHFLRRYPFYLANLLYAVDFVWKRVCPKLPVAQKVYFAVTKGRKRVLSLAEGLGRLYFCGFEILAMEEIDEWVYFIARKVKVPSDDPSPSYGPLIRLRRVGRDGNMFNLFKLRTMYPYSEYLQDYVYQLNQLQQGGKFKDDFRITSWGRVFRKLWIDELPQFINLFRRQVKLVGVRALSRHYFDLYPEEMRRRRIRTKPGLVPPFFVDLPETFDEIVESESRYLRAYFKRPRRTDFVYFWKAMWNIVVKGKRSV